MAKSTTDTTETAEATTCTEETDTGAGTTGAQHSLELALWRLMEVADPRQQAAILQEPEFTGGRPASGRFRIHP